MRQRHAAWEAGLVLGAMLLASPLHADDVEGYTSGEKVSYSIGYDLGRKMAADVENLDLAPFRAGLEDAYHGREPKLARGEMDFIVGEFSREVARRARDRRERSAARNAQESREFLENNASREGVRVTASGLQYRVLEPGRGARPTPGSTVRVHHRGRFADGSEFESTDALQPAEFVLGEGVLPGYREALQRMRVGSHWEIVVPPQLAYGAAGRPASGPGELEIEPNATLIFEIELLAVTGAGSGMASEAEAGRE